MGLNTPTSGGTGVLGVSVGTSEIEGSAVTTAKIADDAVTLAKMAAGTAGNLITYNASGDPAAVATGTAGQILTSAGAGQPPAFSATVALANGGTGAALADPNADRLMFWDDSAGATAYLTAGTGLTITDTTIAASAGGAQSVVLGTGIDSAVRLYSMQRFTGGSATHTLTANRLYLVPFVAPSGVKAKRILARVVAGVGSAKVKLGIYASDANGMPNGAAIVESGDLDGATAPANISYTPGASVALTAGKLYWTCIVSDSAVGIRGTNTFLIDSPVGITEAGISGFSFASSASVVHTYGALPSSPSALTGVSSSSTIALIFMEFEAQ